MSIQKNLENIALQIKGRATLVAVTKTRSVEEMQEVYQQGYRVFGENRVQEILRKKPLFPNDVAWHLIGHLQSNKVKQILPHVDLIHGVDSEKLLHEINKEAGKAGIKPRVLLQIYIATEESKFGLDHHEANALLQQYQDGKFEHVTICGLMGMASNVESREQIEKEFSSLQQYYQKVAEQYTFLNTLSMGMSGDYELALQHGSNMVRIGSAIFKNEPA
jgi:hypothetical protein